MFPSRFAAVIGEYYGLPFVPKPLSTEPGWSGR